MVLRTPWIGLPALALLFGVPCLWPHAPVAPLMLLAAIGAGLITGLTPIPEVTGFSPQLPRLVLPENWGTIWHAVERAVLPQMPLTLTNAFIVTAAICHDLYPDRADRTTARNLALTSGAANLLLAPFGAMSMCHGAGSVTAQHRFGARTGLAPILFGAVLLIPALGCGQRRRAVRRDPAERRRGHAAGRGHRPSPLEAPLRRPPGLLARDRHRGCGHRAARPGSAAGRPRWSQRRPSRSVPRA